MNLEETLEVERAQHEASAAALQQQLEAAQAAAQAAEAGLEEARAKAAADLEAAAEAAAAELVRVQASRYSRRALGNVACLGH